MNANCLVEMSKADINALRARILRDDTKKKAPMRTHRPASVYDIRTGKRVG